MSVLFLKRFLQRPFQVASIIPSSKAMVERVASKMDFSEPRVIAEYGPGEGVHTREIARRMNGDSKLLLFELDPELSRDLERQFANDPRVHVVNGDAAQLTTEMNRLGIDACDYIVSGIPFSILEIEKKRALLEKTYEALAPGGAFIIYQVTNELRQHATLSTARNRSISCRTSRRCSSRFSINRIAGTATAARPCSTLTLQRLDDARRVPDREGLDGRDARPGVRVVWGLDAAGGAEFSGQRLSLLAAVHSRAWADQMGRGAGESRSRVARRTSLRPHRAGGGRGAGRQTSTSISRSIFSRPAPARARTRTRTR